MGALRVAAAQATYVLMNREATIDRVEELTAAASPDGAHLVVFPGSLRARNADLDRHQADLGR